MKEKKPMSGKTKLVLTMLGLLAIVFVNPGGVFTAQKVKDVPLSEAQLAAIRKEAAERADATMHSEMIVRGKRAVLAHLKDPDSAEFKNVRYGDSSETGPAAYGFVNSKNSLGGFTGFQRFISNGKTVLLEEGDNNLKAAWSALESASAALKP